MNISNQVQIIYVPLWVRAAVFVFMTASVLACAYLFYSALSQGDRPDWISAGAYLLGVIFPVMLLVLVLAGASFGESSIRRRTEHMLIETIPYHLQFIPETRRSFRPYPDMTPTDPARDELAKIRLHHARGTCHADYCVTFADASGRFELELRVELNVKRANVNFVIPQARLARLMQAESAGEDVGAFLRAKFRHSLAVEALQSRDQQVTSEQGASTIAYSFNRELLSRRLDGVDYVVVVATTALRDDTVWNPSERVYFAQDLMFMLRALMQEYPAIFQPEGAADA